MTPTGQSLCLCMIVKEEAHVIRRCLASVRPVVDYWIIVDTGSIDGTQDIVRAAMAGLPGKLVERPWRDFAHNRSEALDLARPHGTYTLIIDADDALRLPPNFAMPSLDADSYVLDIEDSGVHYRRTQIVRSALPWHYRGVLHEFLACEGASSVGTLPLTMLRNHDGARRRNPQTYHRDAQVLERALAGETDPFLISRYTFYLAQSYRDCGEQEKALEHYLARAELGFWDQEVFVALLQAARLAEALGHPDQVVLDAYQRATDALPTRAEALHDASRFCRTRGRFEEGCRLAERGLSLSSLADGLFVEGWIYAYGLLDELAVNAYWAERFEVSLAACDRLHREGQAPQAMHGRIAQNRRFAAERLAEHAAARSGLSPRCAVITPYYTEDALVLARCIESVRRQTVAAMHILVADGRPQAWIAEAGVRHMTLDRSHGDYGGTPRAIGAMLAVSEGYEAIALLDADNWFETEHLQHCLDRADAVPGGACDYVIARSRFVRTDGSVMNLLAESVDEHVDTSCFVFLRGSFHLLPIWGLQPKPAARAGDRFFYQALRGAGLQRALAERVTVNYTSLWESHYRLLGETPPAGAKPNVSGAAIDAWQRGLTGRERDLAERLMQVRLPAAADECQPLQTAATMVVSVYMGNIPQAVVTAQRRVVERSLPSDAAFVQIETDASHAEALDAFMAATEAEIVVFLDIDCVPLHDSAFRMLTEAAARGALAGCAQRANHIANDGHVYVGPFCMALSRLLWIDLGRPSFRPTERGDVGEELSYLCEARGVPLHLLWPSRVEEPVWDLTGGIRFGFNTEYDGAFLHAFGVRHADNRQRFLDRCGELSRQDDAALAGGEQAGAPRPIATGTDKDYWHRYTDVYERAFQGIGEVHDVFEFGILTGDSVRWLAGRFPEARIVGADIRPTEPSWPVADRIRYVRIDQGDRAGVRAMFAVLGRDYDLLIEDGSHVPEHQAACLVEGLRYVRPGKLYVVEDIHTSHPDNYDFMRHRSGAAANALHLLLAIEHLRSTGQRLTHDIAQELASDAFFALGEVYRLFDEIESVTIYRRSVLPLRCYRCGSQRYDYRTLRCLCGSELYAAADSMSALIRKRARVRG